MEKIKELKKLKRAELLDLLLEVTEKNEMLKQKIETLSEQLTSRELTIQNAGFRRISVDVSIQKTDTNPMFPLSGVEFALYAAEVNENGEWAVIDSDTPLGAYIIDENGFFTLNPIEAGNYLLYETKAAADYELPKESWRITAQKNGDIVFTNSSGQGVDTTDFDDGIDIYHIINSKIYVLPSTGDIGSEIIYISALFLILASVGGFLYQKKCRRKGGCYR